MLFRSSPKLWAYVDTHNGFTSSITNTPQLTGKLIWLLKHRGIPKVAVAHAGWRGLAAGVLENTVKSLDVDPNQILAWLGPAIGARVFEVGPEVRQAFMAGHPDAAAAFVPSPYRLKHYMADLYRLATQRLQQVGVEQVFGGNFCTLTDQERFYSFRRDGQQSGRMASVIWLD